MNLVRGSSCRSAFPFELVTGWESLWSNAVNLTQHSKSHLRDLPQINAVCSALARAKPDRDVPPAQGRIALQRQGERNILNVEIFGHGGWWCLYCRRRH